MADYFTTFIQNLLGTPSPTGSMFGGTFVDPQTGMVDRARLTGDAADYYANPFRKQDAILDAALKQKETEQAVQKVQGMFSGDGGPNADLNPYVAAYLEAGGGEAGMQAQEYQQYLTFLQSPKFVQDMLESLMPGKVNQMENSFMAVLNQQAEQERGGWEAAAAAEQMAELNQQAEDDLAAWNAYESYNNGDSGGGGGVVGGGTGMTSSNADAVGDWL